MNNIDEAPEITLYDCTTLCELKKKTFDIVFDFDPTQYGSKNIMKRRVYWQDLFDIHDQTIMSWQNCLESSSRPLDLRYAFFWQHLLKKHGKKRGTLWPLRVIRIRRSH